MNEKQIACVVSAIARLMELLRENTPAASSEDVQRVAKAFVKGEFARAGLTWPEGIWS